MREGERDDVAAFRDKCLQAFALFAGGGFVRFGED